MAAGPSLPTGEVELTFGNTFTKNHKDESFHSIRYDFKPASVDTKKKGTVVIGDKYDITVTVPHVESSGTSQTVFKGSKLPSAKECLLIIDHNTGKITLERFSQRIRVKKYRPETGGNKKNLQSAPLEKSSRKPSPSQNYSPSHTLSRGGIPSSSPSLSRPSPSHNSQRSSPSYKSSSHSQKSHSNNSATSMPMLGFEEEAKDEIMSDSSSDSDSDGSSSSSDSDSDSEPDNAKTNKVNSQGMMNGGSVNHGSPSVFDDLQLSDED